MKEVDYLIIGAGSAGCVLAARLAESGLDEVVVLEAGGWDSSLWLKVPIGYGMSFYNPKVNWMYETEPDPNLSNTKAFWPRGKVIGGSSSINAMVYMRGHPGDFDDWAALGNHGWSYDEVLPFFKKSEQHCFGPSTYHGADGPLGVSDFSDQVHPLCQNFLEACSQNGIPPTDDFNGAQMEGAGLWQMNILNGFRSSTSTAFLKPALHRINLNVLTEAHATRILFDGKVARGVEYTRGGVRHIIKARREVILSAGAINTPQILELSGIGQAERLQALNIPVVHANNRVGEGLQDHVAVCYFYRSKVPTLNQKLGSLTGKVAAGLQYLLTRKGPLGMSVNQAGAFMRSRPDLERPNLHLYFNPISYTIPRDTRPKIAKPDPFQAFLMSFNTCRPTSRGHIHIKSSDPREAPSIQTNCLSTEEDIRDVYDGARVLRALANTEALQAIIDHEYLPGSQCQSDDEVLADFRARAATVYHASCTAGMGVDPQNSVVSPDLKVHGVERLRVVDASVFPTVTSGNTNAPTIMVAEKAAELILAEV